ncbi:MAG TPA: hypothetical protein VFV58_19140 [Blastocatellia bacterium]|nr:hypothetical protein [Blastocatellia bacterium]
MMGSKQSGSATELSKRQASQSFPPRRDFTSLSMRDLLDAREAYHVHLSSLENVIATAIGRYRIHERDWYASHPPDDPRPSAYPRVSEPRTLSNSIVKPWSWPAVIVFVRQWDTPEKLGNQVAPHSLYLPDGRVVPTCVIQAAPDEAPPPPAPGPSQTSPLLGGGYSCLREHQGATHLGTIGCLVYKEGSYYALTNRHVAGRGGEVISAYTHGAYHPIGACADMGVTRLLMPEIFPTWPGNKTYLTLDAGLIRVDNIEDWTSQVFGIGEIGLPFDATEQAITLDLIGCPVRAFGGTSGVIEGEIQALFFRYESLGGYDYTTDTLIGPRTGSEKKRSSVPFTLPGDSGALWFYDPPYKSGKELNPDVEQHAPPEKGERARRLRPIAMQWGGQRFRDPDGSSGAFALASFISSITRALDVQVVRDWSTGHDEYWGKLGHFAVGWKACELLSGSLATLMLKNQARIGFGDERLGEGSEFRLGTSDFVPLADVADYVWVNSREYEPIQHFADIDIYDIDGGPTLLEQCIQDPQNVSAKVWKRYFDGFAEAGVGPEEGVLPFRVWQIWDAMVKYLKIPDVIHFVAAAGVLAHYIGDASQPLHCSYLHHGAPPMTEVGGRQYPFPRSSNEFEEFKNTRQYKIHAIYEQTMLEIDTPTALAAVNEILVQNNAQQRIVRSGYEAAVETVRLMRAAQDRLAPMAIIAVDNPESGPKTRAKALWNKPAIRNATVDCLADSVFLLADLWTSAWVVGDGDSIAPSELVQFEERDLKNIYRREHEFLPSLSLAKMAETGNFEPD